MEIDLQVNFKSMKNQTTLHKNIPHMSSAVSKGKEHSQRHRSWKVMCLAGMSKRACFTCKTSQYVNISERFTQVVQNTHMHNRFHSQQACLVFWRIDTYSQLSNNLHICSLKIQQNTTHSLTDVVTWVSVGSGNRIFTILLPYICFCLWAATSAREFTLSSWDTEGIFIIFQEMCPYM